MIQFTVLTKKREYINMSLQNTIERLSATMDKLGLTELEAENSFLLGLFRRHIHLSKQQAVPVSATHTAAATAIAPEPVAASAAHSGTVIKSPMVGVAYLAPEPGAKPFATIGASVRAGDTICLIEAMKTFNPVKAGKDGILTEYLIKDGDAVEFEMPLAVIN
jgi:acetyl-CoA carboxylase biotin carboxyl carrier protein